MLHLAHHATRYITYDKVGSSDIRWQATGIHRRNHIPIGARQFPNAFVHTGCNSARCECVRYPGHTSTQRWQTCRAGCSKVLDIDATAAPPSCLKPLARALQDKALATKGGHTSTSHLKHNGNRATSKTRFQHKKTAESRTRNRTLRLRCAQTKNVRTITGSFNKANNGFANTGHTSTSHLKHRGSRATSNTPFSTQEDRIIAYAQPNAKAALCANEKRSHRH